MARLLRSLLFSPRTPLHFRPTPPSSLQLTPSTLALIPWSCALSSGHPSCSSRDLTSSPRASYATRPILPRRRAALRRKQERRTRKPELDVSICIEEELPDDPQIKSIAETLRKDVPDAMKVAFESLKDPKYQTRDKSIKNVNKFLKIQLSLLLCDDAFIRKLNKEWRDEDSATDVLSWSQHIPGLGIPILLLGDIVISVETAARQAEERGHTLLDEIRILMVHGLLHLLGFDHEISCEAEKEMEIEEERVLSSLGWRGKGLIQSAYDSLQDEDNFSDLSQDIKKATTVKDNKPKLSHILFDIDDKLLDNDGQMLLKSVGTFKEVISREAKIIIITEKSRAAITRAVEIVNLEEYISVSLSPGIFLHGAVVYGMQGREIYRENLDQDICREAFFYSLEHEIPLVAFSIDQCLSLFEHSFLESLHNRHYEPKTKILPSILDLPEDSSIQKLSFLRTAGNSSTLQTHLSEITKGRARIVESHPDVLEVIPLNASKSNGVKILLDHLGINTDEFEIAENWKWLGDRAALR
ncbi:Endoribonuclease YbeY [Rhynchospora pubera]|uniref:Endoribonuclease YbeY n=1 Tax=Rhynchospora pubera TaxID=906938 RepID=A0AAV8DS33_9POAL|nr:Endoribonuclease YbeY [Rhynchospora pubera]